MSACAWKFELAGQCYSSLTTITAHEPQALACADFRKFVTPRGLTLDASRKGEQPAARDGVTEMDA